VLLRALTAIFALSFCQMSQGDGKPRVEHVINSGPCLDLPMGVGRSSATQLTARACPRHCAIADVRSSRLWVKDTLDPEEEKLRFSK